MILGNKTAASGDRMADETAEVKAESQEAVAEASAPQETQEAKVDGSVGDSAEVKKLSYEELEAKYKDAVSGLHKKASELAAYKRKSKGAPTAPPEYAPIDENQVKALDPDDPAVPILKQLIDDRRLAQEQAASTAYWADRAFNQELASRVNDLESRCSQDGFELDKKALTDTVRERGIPLFDDDGQPIDLFWLAKELQPDEYARALKKKGVAEYLAEQEAHNGMAATPSSGATAPEATQSSADKRRETAGFLQKHFGEFFGMPQ